MNIIILYLEVIETLNYIDLSLMFLFLVVLKLGSHTIRWKLTRIGINRLCKSSKLLDKQGWASVYISRSPRQNVIQRYLTDWLFRMTHLLTSHGLLVLEWLSQLKIWLRIIMSLWYFRLSEGLLMPVDIIRISEFTLLGYHNVNCVRYLLTLLPLPAIDIMS